MKDELIERLHGSELFLRNIAKAKPAPLNGYSKECLLDASEYICQAIERIRYLEKLCRTKDISRLHTTASLVTSEQQRMCAMKNLEAMAVTMRNSAKATRDEAIKEFAERLKENTLPVQIGKHEYKVITEQGIDHFLNEMTGEG